ncbi:hypothetical protein CTI12_AA543640 [Artemisia annua]|uniref:Uncharacterized protein n=1 Tax=Artemisia annua TaxID=35608 RepID=A0A2U1L155_ARTAN|nr:hypothetical protein CTI12_AA543640 [Artemisia annua]
MDLDILAKAHSYVLFNCSEVDEFRTYGDSFMGPQHDETMDIELVRGGFDGTVVDNNGLVIADEEDPVEAA